MTDQTVMKMMKEDIKKYQKQLKENKDNPEKMLELQKKVMDINMQYLMCSLKPTMVTMIPVLLVFSWLSAHYAYESIAPGQEFTVSVAAAEGISGGVVLEAPPELYVDQQEKELKEGHATWKVKGKEGEYLLTIKTQGNDYDKDIIISSFQQYAPPEKEISDGVIEKIEVLMKPLTVLVLFGWQMGWLGTYILFSILFSITLRKVMDIH